MKNFTLLISKDAEEYLINQLSIDKAIQIRLKNSGCSGYSYILNVVVKSKDNFCIKNIHFDILEEDKALLKDTLIDYKKDGLNSKIVFENPQSFNHCGCGESFSIRK